MPSIEALVYLNTDREVTKITIEDDIVDFKLIEPSQKVVLPCHAVAEFLCKNHDQPALAAIAATASSYTAAVPWCNLHLPRGGQYASGTSYILPAQISPKLSFFPLNNTYASGFTLVEIEPLLSKDTGAALSDAFFRTSSFGTIRDKFVQSVRADYNQSESIPGFVLKDTISHLKPFSSASFKNDPIW